MEIYGNLLNTFSDYLIYDERKERVLHTRYLNRAQFYEMWRFHFNRLRPEFSAIQNQELAMAQRLTRGVMGYLRHYNGREVQRCYRLDPEDFPSETCQKILHNHLNYMSPSPASPLFPKMTSWKDASLSWNYVTSVTQKVEKYGLQYPLMSRPLSQEQKANLEEQLYQHFKELLSS